MHRVQRRSLVVWMRKYILRKMGGKFSMDKYGLPMWQDFITHASENSDFLKYEGMTKESLLFLNEAVGPGGEASNDAAHDFDNAELEAAITPQADIAPGLHREYWAMYYKKKCDNVV